MGRLARGSPEINFDHLRVEIIYIGGLRPACHFSAHRQQQYTLGIADWNETPAPPGGSRRHPLLGVSGVSAINRDPASQ